jgi:hypothetical protein
MQTKAEKSKLRFFVDDLVSFFKDLAFTFPEERDLKVALEYLEFANKSNPRLVLDLFYENVYMGAHEMIKAEDEQGIIEFARAKIQTQYTEISSALGIFDKHWDGLDEKNRKTIWTWLKILCVRCEKARATI